MSWMEEVSYQYRQTEYFFIDVPAIFQYCLPALLVQFLRTSLLLLFVNAVHQLITTDVLFSGRTRLKSVLASLLGSLVLLNFYPLGSVALLWSLVLLSYLLLAHKRLAFILSSSLLASGWITGIFSIDLRSIQGPLMILAMKVICVAMLSGGSKDLSTFLHYCLCPSSAVFGPIIPFDDFRKNIFHSRFYLPIGSIISGIAATFLTFITANCICQSVEWVSTEDIAPYHIRFLTAYKSALEFRMSHYFICYLSTFQMYMGAPKLAEPIVDFWSIEVPRSTKSVVRAWNRPMHNFLKKFVFQKIRPSLGPSVAVVATFFISAALHLFEIRVMVVLFGLSIISLIESRLDRHFPKKILEIWLRCTTFVHLVFFGCIMQYDEEPDGSYLNYVMERWLELGFISFKILLVECVLCVALDLRDIWGRRNSQQK